MGALFETSHPHLSRDERSDGILRAREILSETAVTVLAMEVSFVGHEEILIRPDLRRISRFEFTSGERELSGIYWPDRPMRGGGI